MATKEEELVTLKNKALFYLRFRARTVYEMKRYLQKKAETYGFASENVDQTIEYLLKEKYLDDEDFSRIFVDSRLRHKPKSSRVLSLELRQKGVNQELADKILAEQVGDETPLAALALAKKQKAWTNFDKNKIKKLAYDYLSRRGFSYDIIKKATEEFIISLKI